jgi:hypothetical protein
VVLVRGACAEDAPLLISLTSKFLTPSLRNVVPVTQAVPQPSAAHVHCVLVRSARHFVVGMFSLRLQREHTEEVRMKIHSTNRQMPMLCAAAAADNRALLG